MSPLKDPPAPAGVSCPVPVLGPGHATNHNMTIITVVHRDGKAEVLQFFYADQADETLVTGMAYRARQDANRPSIPASEDGRHGEIVVGGR